MTFYKNRYRAFFLMLFSAFGILAVQAQDAEEREKIARITSLIESKNYVFQAQTVLPLRGPTQQLTSEYDLRIMGDTLKSFLPYFGRAFVAPIGTSESGLQFTSTDFIYKVKEKRKGGWEIRIEPNDTRDVRQLFLTITDEGYATLRVNSNNRQPISFYGYIDKRK